MISTHLCILLGRIKEVAEVLVSIHVLVSSLPPLGHRLAVEDENVEEGVQQKNRLRLNRSRVQQHRNSALLIECVRVQSRLDHDQRIRYVFVIQHMAVKRSLVG